MNILPTPSGPPRPGAARVKDSSATVPARSGPGVEGAAGETRDRAEISPEALELNGGPTSAAPEIPAPRMREVLERLSNGHYDREDAQAQVLKSIARDLGIL